MRVFWLYVCGFVLVGVFAPLAQLSARVGDQDPSDIYLMISAEPDQMLAQMSPALGVREVGLIRAPFATLLQVPKPAQQQLHDAGVWLVPAQALSALCGPGGADATPLSSTVI